MAESLDIRKQGNKSIQHNTQTKVVTGAVVVTVNNNGENETILLESMSEPQEQTIGAVQPVNVIHMLHPLEWVVPAYNGGSFNLMAWETWYKTPYEEAGFEGVQDFIRVINHRPFKTDIITYRPNGSVGRQTCFGCRVTGPIIPQGQIARGTTTRQLRIPVSYTYMARK